ncbi:hypothetical protein TSUD_289530 [Trifolium subterraneum]|uniref:Integrase catalytic domain-containing protein n=1 Tax=Trifolium subterraneum TaxID=3900 RepID=A0A2Z6MGN9_TRISU|nr:hypothetical protein TSUD_289530 [Trifolium subterraneum]
MDPESSRTLDDVERRLDDRLTQLQQQRNTDMEEIRSLLRVQLEQGSPASVGRQGSHGPRRVVQTNQTRISKVDFPRFDGKNVREWLYKCDQFFLFDETPPTSMVRLASIHLDGLTLQWHLTYMRQKFDIYPYWQQYVSDVTARFGDAYEDALSSLLLIKHTGTIQDYIDQFELALTQVTLLPEHSLSIFLAGLEKHTQMHVRMFNPTSIAHAANLAKLHEASLPPKQHTSSRFSPFSKTQGLITKPTISSPSTTTNSSISPTTKPLTNRTTRIYSAIEMAERRAKGLCMFCDEQFTPGHQFKHKRGQIMVLEIEDDDIMVEEPTEETKSLESDSLQSFENAQLSLQALTGIANYHTMRVTGVHDKKLLHILLDSGSTHNFLDLEIAKSLGCKLEAISPLSVTGGGGHQLEAAFICRGFQWQLQQVSFTADVIVLPLVCCDLILGIQWLKALGPILWDFDKLQMEFSTNGRKVVLRGAKTPSFKLINNKSFAQMVKKDAELCFLSIMHQDSSFVMPSCHALPSLHCPMPLPNSIEQLIDTYAAIFSDPTTLPPPRAGFDHMIPLKAGAQPFNLRPYRFSIVQKDIIDKLVHDMLAQGIIQHSTSPFASPTILVRKKDGSWRLCVDFRRLNELTIKDRFPIPLIEDLMDELHSSIIFSKLDMRSGYHQLRMAPGEEYKTAFKTHSSHFEFLVIMTQEGVSIDPIKIQAVNSWQIPQTLKQLRGFLGLAGYYRRFVQNFGTIAKPLTDLLKKDSFLWTEEATNAFNTLKHALVTAPVLALPDFSKQFVVETDASGKGIGAVLMQDQHPIAYIRKSLGPKQQAMSVYERELLAIVYAVQKWGSYLSHAPFIIKTDQKSIKYMLDQKLNTPFQQVWVAKLPALLLSNVDHNLLESIINHWQQDPYLQTIIHDLQKDSKSHPKFSWTRDELRRNGKLVIGANTTIKDTILTWLHSSVVGGHSVRDVTASRVKSLFYWKGMTKDIFNFVKNCGICQKNKSDLAAYPGLLQPLPVPHQIWTNISMDFVEGLPTSGGKQVIFVVVDRLSKYAHFMALAHPYTALDVAQVFLDNVFKLHGLPESITSDRDPIFLSSFWTEFFKLQGVALNKSSAYHPQTDGQTEVVNKCLETYLRCMCSDEPKKWFNWLSLAEWWYNTNYHSSIHTTPFEVVYGQPPPIHLPYLPGSAENLTVDRSLMAREEAIKLLKFHLLRAHNRMAQQANKHRSDRVFAIGDYVYLKLQPYRQLSMKSHGVHKLLPKFYGPYQLKLCPNPQHQPVQHLPATLPTVEKIPVAILERKMVKRGHTAATKVLVQWKDSPPDKATWEFYYDLLKKFPDFHP